MSSHVEPETVDTTCAHECANTVMSDFVVAPTVFLGIAFVDMSTVDDYFM